MEDKEINLNNAVFKVQFREYNVEAEQGTMLEGYKEIQARLRVISYA
jgi:hypothetical protein